MILELADIRIHAGQNAAFEEAIERGLKTVVRNAKGFQGFKVNRSIESPQRYLLQIFWDTLE
ncbi:MAG: antibiotic biosynthesis monooxygenase, partial [Betaproteobacteria bacterium]|nr:antibiotic biosynthesis monooxygenase [Betaproteobacteria bacterium]